MADNENLVFISSKLIQIYPTANRGKNKPSTVGSKENIFNPESRLFTEENNTRNFDKLADFLLEGNKKAEGSFIISESKTSSPFEFILNGYYFRINLPFYSTTPSTEGNYTCIADIIKEQYQWTDLQDKEIYAYINITERAGTDEDNIKFRGRTLIPCDGQDVASLDTLEGEDESIFKGLAFVNASAEEVASASESDKYLLVWEDNDIPTKSKIKFSASSVHGGENKPLNELLRTETVKPITIENQYNYNDTDEEYQYQDLEIKVQNKHLQIKSLGNDSKITIENAGEKLDIKSKKDINIEANTETNNGKLKLKRGKNEIELADEVKIKSKNKPISLQTDDDGENLKVYELPNDKDGWGDWTNSHKIASRDWIDFKFKNDKKDWKGDLIITNENSCAEFQLRHAREGNSYNILQILSLDGSASGIEDHTGYIQIGQPDLRIDVKHYGDLDLYNADNEVKIHLGNDGYIQAEDNIESKGDIEGQRIVGKMFDSFDADGNRAPIYLCSRSNREASGGASGGGITVKYNSIARSKTSLNDTQGGFFLSPDGLSLGTGAKLDPNDSTDRSKIRLDNNGQIIGRKLSIKNTSTINTYELLENPLTAPATIDFVCGGNLEPYYEYESVPPGTYVWSDPDEVSVNGDTITARWNHYQWTPPEEGLYPDPPVNMYLIYELKFDYVKGTRKQSLIFCDSGYRLCAISYNTDGNVSYGTYASGYTSPGRIFPGKLKLADVITGSFNIKDGSLFFKPASYLSLGNFTQLTNELYNNGSEVLGKPSFIVSDGKYNAYEITPSGGHGTTPPVTSSDKNVKNSITKISEQYEKIFDLLKPVTYKLSNGYSGRTHIGFIAQDVKKAIEKAGLTTKDMGAYCEYDKPFIDGSTCGLRYEEFIALNTHEIQKLKKEIKDLKAEIKKLKD